jgi:hypothetical protein
MSTIIEIAGEYGTADGSIHILDEHGEVVMWDSAEWIEDSSLVFVIAEAVREALQVGTDGIRMRLGRPPGEHSTCRHCGQGIVLSEGVWMDPEATGDDSIWRETCGSHDTFTAEHEPET